MPLELRDNLMNILRWRREDRRVGMRLIRRQPGVAELVAKRLQAWYQEFDVVSDPAHRLAGDCPDVGVESLLAHNGAKRYEFRPDLLMLAIR